MFGIVLTLLDIQIPPMRTHNTMLSYLSSIVSPKWHWTDAVPITQKCDNAWIYAGRREEEKFSSKQFSLTFSLHIGQIVEKMSKVSIILWFLKNQRVTQWGSSVVRAKHIGMWPEVQNLTKVSKRNESPMGGQGVKS